MIIRKSEREIDKIAAAGALVAETIAYTGGLLRAGVTTEELDAAAGAFIREHDGTPTSEGYKGYPKAICISPNDVVVHGIPDGFEVGDGDLVTIDVGVTLDGYIADSAYTFGVGVIEARDQRLLDVAQEALAAGIAEAVVGIASATCRTRSRRSWRRAASRSSGASSATASAGTTTRTRTSRTSARRAAARGSPRA